jgi:hypothetical protein
MVSTLSVDAIRDSFPHPNIPRHTGTPTYAAINIIHKKLKANASSIPSELGGGTHGLLGLVLSAPAYINVTGHVFVPPVNPGPTAVIPRNLRLSAQINELVRQHANELRIFQETTRTDQALKQQLLNAFDDMYTKSLSNRHTGFATITTFDIIQHLYQTYGMISQVNIKDNTARMNEPYDPTTPIENLFDQIEVAAEYAEAANHPFSVQQIVTTGYLLIFATGLYTEECKLWNRRPQAEQTWVNFKLDFSRAHKELREMQAMTAQMGAATMGMANMVHGANRNTEDEDQAQLDTAQALSDLATATVADRTAVANLTQANATLTSQLTDMKAMLQSMSDQIKNLQSTQPRQYDRTYDRNSEHYCWSHGRTRNPNHISSNCRNKKPGHKDDATLHNRMGGSNYRCNSNAQE